MATIRGIGVELRRMSLGGVGGGFVLRIAGEEVDVEERPLTRHIRGSEVREEEDLLSGEEVREREEDDSHSSVVLVKSEDEAKEEVELKVERLSLARVLLGGLGGPAAGALKAVDTACWFGGAGKARRVDCRSGSSMGEGGKARGRD